LVEEKTLKSRLIYQGRAFTVRQDTVINASGEETTRDIVEHAECIIILPVEANGDILLVRQFRKALEKDLLELPAGGIDPGEDPETAVIRESQEEIGLLPGKITRLMGFYSTPGFCNEFLYLYLAEDFKPSRLYAEDTPGIEVVPLKPSQVREMIRSGEICDSKTIAGLLYYLDSLPRKQG
jgi:ADP-ribose pyrophosphatase